MNLPEPIVEKIREDRFTFRWRDGDGPEFEAGYDRNKYPARVTSLVAKFTPDGELVSVNVSAKKVKKDGTLSMTNAYVPWKFDGFDDALREWRKGHG